MSRNGSISITIVEAIAHVEDVDLFDLDFSLEDYVDTDALDALGGQTDTEWTIQLTVADHAVTVDSQEGVTVDGEPFPGTDSREIPRRITR